MQPINILFDILCSIYHLFNNEVVDDDKFALMLTLEIQQIKKKKKKSFDRKCSWNEAALCLVIHFIIYTCAVKKKIISVRHVENN